MLKLNGKIERVSGSSLGPMLLTITRNPALPLKLRETHAFLSETGETPAGFGTILLRMGGSSQSSEVLNVYRLPADFDYVSEGDIVRINPSKSSMHTLYRRSSRHNTILLTEQCNNYCLMCSQPPKRINDSWLLDEAFKLIEMMPVETEVIGFSGGEPTLYGHRLVDLIRHTKNLLPRTHVDILSNGRAFKDVNLARSLCEVNHPSCVLGIPLYSDDPVRHDYVVQSDGAFDETIRGILNLKRFAQKVEIRIVLHKQTIERLVQTCEFIARNLLFVDHVALMGLEITGFTRANLDKLWIDPFHYKDVLSEAIHVLNSYGINTSIYNHQLCVINKDAEPNYTKSISDWKNEYLDACSKCSRRGDCGGFFSSSKLYRHSDHIEPIPA